MNEIFAKKSQEEKKRSQLISIHTIKLVIKKKAD